MKRFSFVLMLVLGMATGCSEKPREAATQPVEKAVEQKAEPQPVQKASAVEKGAKEKSVVQPEKALEPVRPVKAIAVEKTAVKPDAAAVQKTVEKAAAPAVAAETAKQEASRPAANIEQGARLYKARCMPCHGAEGKGTAMAPAFKRNEWVKGASSSEIALVIKEGRAGAAKKYQNFSVSMPATKGVTDEEVNALVGYIGSIN